MSNLEFRLISGDFFVLGLNDVSIVDSLKLSTVYLMLAFHRYFGKFLR